MTGKLVVLTGKNDDGTPYVDLLPQNVIVRFTDHEKRIMYEFERGADGKMRRTITHLNPLPR